MRARWWYRRRLPRSLALLCMLTVLLIIYLGSNDIPDIWSADGIEQRPSIPSPNSASHFHAQIFTQKHVYSLNKNISINPSNGEDLAKALYEKCQTQAKIQKRFTLAVSSSQKYNIMLCPMCKLASTFWTRFFIMLQSYSDPDINTPYDIPITDAPPTNERVHFSHHILSPGIYNNQYKFLFVRNPYTRLLSAFVDKLFAPNPTFWRGVCTNIIRSQRHFPVPFQGKPVLPLKKCGSDLKFEEYIRAIVVRHRVRRFGSVDCHDAEFHSTCHTCDIRYDFVGKMENFMDDSFFLYRKLGLNKTVAAANEFPWLLDNDAIYDTVSSAFSFKDDVFKCISWDEALRRVWRKLQIRGVIGKEAFPLSARESNRIDVDEFVWLVKETRLNSTFSERKKQRKEALIEIYRSVPIDLLKQLRTVFSTDFELFAYESSPDDIFNRDQPIIPFGYLSV